MRATPPSADLCVRVIAPSLPPCAQSLEGSSNPSLRKKGLGHCKMSTCLRKESRMAVAVLVLLR